MNWRPRLKLGSGVHYGTDLEISLTGCSTLRIAEETTAEMASSVEPVVHNPVNIAPLLEADLKLNVYPNPFQVHTNIAYNLSEATNIKLYIRNTLGQLVKVLHQGQQNAGVYRTQLQAGNLAAGVYYLTLETPKERKVEKSSLQEKVACKRMFCG